ncbi:non-hydrolyzing UDP-N-acetylglucosamine 2-epimerase [Thiobacillus sp.]|uniref:non-hydrolyzing UDP-N-acetylglucosamine 2-epimerase n=1 Tax=Thiobacillus sp. TaxID=924 RepID=UPI0025D3FC92|nr:UDP-N-acetylglucosamine 2-epimerase (non-hydrolyzing) [Thiobacillus sp.]MBT9540112.1 UDP-N-acetylglucosamine 2-epimerase (non-hydrolyzing) [Thiobacillus sp.]
MKQKLKVMTVVGTRPEIIRLSRVLAKLDQYTDHVLVHTGQNYDYELNEIFFDELKLRRPDHFLEAVGGSVAETIGNILARVDPLLESEKPDALLVLGDTNSCLAVIAAKRRKIPIFHMEAGNRCFDQRVPEESNRKVVDHLADINMPYSTIARDYLLREGIPPDRVVKTGSPMHEVIHHYLPLIEASTVLTRLGVEPEQYFVVSCHREENVDSDRNLGQLVEVLNGLAEQYGLRIIMSTHPRTRNRLTASGAQLSPLVELMKPLGLPDYIQLQRNARAVLSDSGTITEEASILNFPALNIREAHERPEGMEEGTVMMTGLSLTRISQALDILADQPRSQRLILPVQDYAVENVSDKVLRIILSYTDYVKRVVWRQ